MSVVEKAVRTEEMPLCFGDSLYGLEALRRARTREEWLAALAMIDEQEAAHILEGMNLLQWDSREFDFDNLSVIDPYTGCRAIDTCQNAIEALAEDAPIDLSERLSHDKRAASAADDLMRYGELGQGFWRLLPYAYELNERAARGIGMWPEEQRSYLHFYRKAGPGKLEFTVVTIDGVDLAWHRAVLEKQTRVSLKGKTSYELGGLFVPAGVSETTSDRDQYLLSLLAEQTKLQEALSEARFFIDAHQPDIKMISQLCVDFVQSEKQNRLNESAREALRETLELAQKLGLSGQWELSRLAANQDFDPTQHDTALRMIINVRRYGVWQYLRLVHGGDILEHQLQARDITNYARWAARTAEIMPGCPGGFSMEWHGGETHIGPCDGPCRRKAAVVGIGSWCYECITGPKGC